jgi:hypothetical protein
MIGMRRVNRFKAKLHKQRAVVSASTAEGALRQTPPFSYMPLAERRALVQCLREVRLEDGQAVYMQGSAATEVYLLAEGRMAGVAHASGETQGNEKRPKLFLSAPAVCLISRSLSLYLSFCVSL